MPLWKMMRIGPALCSLCLLFAACTGVAPPQPEPTEATHQTAMKTVAAGYGTIVDKYIDTVSLPRIALDGLKGIKTLDPALSVARSGDTVSLASHNQVARRFPAPDDNDVDGWADLTARAYAAARGYSASANKASMEQIYEAVFDGALSDLDTFTHYSGTEQANRNRDRRNGFGGIGIRFTTRDGPPRITSVRPDTPAADADLKVDDVIAAIDGTPTAGMSSRDAAKRLRGPIETFVTLTVNRPKATEPLIMTLKRTHIVPITVIGKVNDGILTLKVTSFNKSTAESVAREILHYRVHMKSDLKGIVLDLRGNPGGLLSQAIRVADLFLAKGDIVNTEGRHPGSFQHYEATGSDYAQGLPLVVTVDGRTASSSEVLAAALQDQKRGVVIGTSSYGKGTVQTVIRLPNQGEMILTWSRLVAPSGYSLHGLGIRPDICTSGREDDDEQALLRTSTLETPQSAKTVQEWRRVAISDSDGRNSLRKTCPASERKGRRLELNLARRLIFDPELYARLLALTVASETSPLRRQSAHRPGS